MGEKKNVYDVVDVPEMDRGYTFMRMSPKEFQNSEVVLDRSIIIFVEKGRCLISVNGKEMVVDDHDILVLFPHYEAKLIEEYEPTEICAIGYYMALQESVTMHIGLSFFVKMMSQARWTMDDDMVPVARAFCTLFEYNMSQGPSAFSSDMAASLFTLFVQTFHNRVKDKLAFDHQTVSVLNRSLWWRFIEQVNIHYKEHHQVAFYAERLCVSPKYLTQIVKRTAHTTPKALIDRRLASESAYLLTRTSQTIQEISIRLGFPDQSYFGRFFKRTFGMSPMAFRLNPDLSLLDVRKPMQGFDTKMDEE